MNYRIANVLNVTEYSCFVLLFITKAFLMPIPFIILLNEYCFLFLIVNWNQIKHFDYLSLRWVFNFTFELHIRHEVGKKNGIFCIIYVEHSNSEYMLFVWMLLLNYTYMVFEYRYMMIIFENLINITNFRKPFNVQRL